MSDPHSDDYFPPFPTLELSLSVPDHGRRQGTQVALIDTGADITLVPQILLDEIKAPELDEARLRSHWGEFITVTTYLVDIQVRTGLLPGVEVVGDMAGDTILLGRNVLNKLVVLIDGPNKITDILADRILSD